MLRHLTRQFRQLVIYCHHQINFPNSGFIRIICHFEIIGWERFNHVIVIVVGHCCTSWKHRYTNIYMLIDWTPYQSSTNQNRSYIHTRIAENKNQSEQHKNFIFRRGISNWNDRCGGKDKNKSSLMHFYFYLLFDKNAVGGPVKQ